MLLTFLLFFRHDGVTESQKAEEVPNLGVSVFHRLHQAVVVEGELWVGQLVPAEVHFFCFLSSRSGEEAAGEACNLPASIRSRVSPRLSPLAAQQSSAAPLKTQKFGSKTDPTIFLLMTDRAAHRKPSH